MKRRVIKFSAVVAVLGVLIAAPWVISSAISSDDGGGRKATGALWQPGTADSGDARVTQPQEPDKDSQRNAEGGTPDSAPKTAEERNAELQRLSKIYAEKGMTPELMKRIAELRAAQGGKATAPSLPPEMMSRLMKQRAAMQGKDGKPPAGMQAQFPQPSAMDPRFVRVAGRITSSEKMALSRDAVMSVRIIDITTADRPRLISEQAVANPGSMPLSFEVWYNRQSIDPKGKYAVQAIVADKGVIKWKTTAECKSVAEGKPAGLEIPLRPYKQPEPQAPGVLVGDAAVTFVDRKPLLVDGEWVLPAAPVLEAAGIDLEYSDSSKELIVQTGDHSLRAKLPGRTVVLQDGSKKELAAALVIRDGAVYAPIQFLQIATGRRALFDRESNVIVLVRL